MPTPQYYSARLISLESKERNDCAVITLSIATGVSYKTAHETLTQLGRKPGRSTLRSYTVMAVEKLGFELRDVTEFFDARTIRTLERELPGKGTYLIGVKRHILCAKDGKIHDHTKGGLKRVKSVWRVSRKNSA